MTKKKRMTDKLDFMQTFKFPPLDKLRENMITRGFTKREAIRATKGLASLPEYK